jgi:hypothetical protein
MGCAMKDVEQRAANHTCIAFEGINKWSYRACDVHLLQQHHAPVVPGNA